MILLLGIKIRLFLNKSLFKKIINYINTFN